ncbi:unnamed protein product [Parnassius apollo]|uniref:(apollo) hypothetical protein n=1 Tax=Parnassius apollo TaxID=110799 RepID=A0A8S3WGD6_PARAO|nr:unnamed protein product [Parnassius apollo]
MHRLFAELEPSLTVTEQNLADRVRYILRSNIFDVAELERLPREAVPSSDENATAEDAAPQMVEQPANVDAAVNTPVVVDSNDDGTVAQELELEHMRSTLEEAIVETRSTPLENRPRLPRIALSKRNRAVVRALNPMLVTYLEASRDLCETDSILFGAALAVCRIIGAKVSTAGRATGHSSAIPAWRRRIEERIAKARALIGRLICFRSGNNRPRIVRTVRMAFAGTNVSLSQPDITQKLTERIDDLKQRIAAWGKRIRRYTERSTRFNQNRLFQSDQKRLYESLERPMVSGTGPAPNQADTVAFWRGLWSEPVNHSEGPWTEVVASQCAGITPMDPVIITPDDAAEAVRRAPNWKSPGLDGLHHYWLKGFMVYTEPDEWNCVATCFFIDCAPNVIEFIERIYTILMPGGFWVNLGPLLYHYSDMPTENSIEPPYDILLDIIRDVGFDILEERTGVKTKYAQNPNSMMQLEYDSVFFVCRKPFCS